MTILISSVTGSGIIMLCDTRVVDRSWHGSIRPLSERKFYWYEGLPFCITAWGDRRLWKDVQALLMKQFTTPSVDEFASLVHDFINIEQNDNDEDFGFHIGGFGPSGPSLYHVYYAVDQPIRVQHARPHVAIEKITPPHQAGMTGLGILFNGRHDIVGPYIEYFARQLAVPGAYGGHNPAVVYTGGTQAVAPTMSKGTDVLIESARTSLEFAHMAESATQGIEVGPPYQVFTLDGESVKKSTYNHP